MTHPSPPARPASRYHGGAGDTSGDQARELGMKVRAPFHVGQDYGFNWLLFAFRAEFNQLDRVQWDYWQVQKLATQGEQLQLRHEAEKAIQHRRLNTTKAAHQRGRRSESTSDSRGRQRPAGADSVRGGAGKVRA